MKKRQQFGGLLVAALLLFTSLFTGTAFAAGTASFSVQPSVGTVLKGGQLSLAFYVNAAGANMYGASVDVTLSGLSFNHYDSTGSTFSYADIATGGTMSSQAFTIAVSQRGSDPGAQGKLFMGTVVVDALNAAGTGTVTLSNGQGLEPVTFAAFGPNAATGTSVSITEPPADPTPPASPAPTCAANQTGTYPNCKDPDPKPKGTSATSPNPDTKSNVPANGSGDTTTVSQQAIADAYKATQSSAKTATIASTSKKKTANMTFFALGGVALLAIIGGAAFFFIRQRRFAGFGQHSTSQIFSSSMTDSAPKEPEPTVDNSKDDPTNPGAGGPSGPTVITPQ